MCASEGCPEAAAARQILADIAAGRVPARPWDGSAEIEGDPDALMADVTTLDRRAEDRIAEVFQ